MNPDRSAVVATTTTPTRPEAERIARELVQRRLAACVQLVDPIRSVYRWEGQVQEDSEVLLVIKSVAALIPAIEGLLRELHPYEVPELLAVRVAAGSRAYLDWLEECVLTPPP